MPCCIYGKLFIGRPCKKTADGLLKLGRHQLKMAVAILIGHAAVRGHLQTMGLFNGHPSCRLCRMETNSAAYNLLLLGAGWSAIQHLSEAVC
jgi:hypothetical protein